MQTEGLVEGVRAVKDPEELAALERAVLLGDGAFNDVADRVQPGWTELQVAWEIEKYAREHGAEAMSFATIVGGGAWGAMPHAYPREMPLEAGKPIVIDMGVIVDGYCSDMTRTIVLGEPDATFQEVYDIVLTAQETAEATVESGMTGGQAHMIAQDIIAEAGYGDRFGHGLGHGVGLEIHEHPRLGRTSEDVLADGMVITVEAGHLSARLGRHPHRGHGRAGERPLSQFHDRAQAAHGRRVDDRVGPASGHGGAMGGIAGW